MTASSVLLGIDVGASKAEWRAGQQLGPGRKPGKGRAGRADIPKNCNEKKLLWLIRALADEYEPGTVGLSLPGFVVGGRLVNLPNLPNVNGGRFMRGLARLRRIGVAFQLENDVKCMALAEWAARGQNADDDFLLVAPGSGIGAAIVREGRLVRGVHNTAGEAGHVKMTDDNGRLADWEALCGGFGIERRFGRRGWDAKRIFLSSDAKARKRTEQSARCFGLGLANLAAVLDPAEIIVAGSVGKAYMKNGRLRRAVLAAYAQNAVLPVKKTPIRPSRVAHPALRGALLLAQGKKDGAIARFLA